MNGRSLPRPSVSGVSILLPLAVLDGEVLAMGWAGLGSPERPLGSGTGPGRGQQRTLAQDFRGCRSFPTLASRCNLCCRAGPESEPTTGGGSRADGIADGARGPIPSKLLLRNESAALYIRNTALIHNDQYGCADQPRADSGCLNFQASKPPTDCLAGGFQWSLQSVPAPAEGFAANAGQRCCHLVSRRHY